MQYAVYILLPTSYPPTSYFPFVPRPPRRIAVVATRYFAQGPLERDPRFRALLGTLAHAGLRIAGAVAIAGLLAYLAFHAIQDDPFVWAETYLTRKDHVAL